MTEGPEQKRLMDRLFGDPARRCLNFNIFPGERAHECSAEELCAEINKALDQVESGEAVPGPHITLESPMNAAEKLDNLKLAWVRQLIHVDIPRASAELIVRLAEMNGLFDAAKETFTREDG